MTVTVAVVDDHAMFRESLAFALVREGFEVVAEAADARDAFEVLEAKHPDVAVVDVALPGVSGFSIAREVVRRRMRSKVLLLTMHEGAHYAPEAFAAGATGFARKSQHVSELVAAIRTVACGDRYFPPDVPRHVAARGIAGNGEGPLAKLSTREREVFDLVVQGKTNKETAAALFVSTKTVETHRANINRKLAVHSTAELMRFASMHGLVR